MKAAIDVSPCYYSRRGVARYIRCLISALRESGDTDLQVEEIGFRIPNFEYRQPWRAIKTAAREFVWQPAIAPLSSRKLGADIVHATCNPCVQAPRGIPKVVTLHDLEMFHTPDRFRAWTRKRFPLDVIAYRAASSLICVSQATADDAMKFLQIPAARLHVVPLGSHFNASSPERAPGTPVPEVFFLFVSALEPGKNLRLLNETYRLAARNGTPLPPLLIVGERVEGVSHEGDPPGNWHYMGRLDDEELAWLYRRSLALLAPTRYEGFGLPVLEAMTLGTAVVCSRISSLPEVGGDVPFYAEQTPFSYLEEMHRVIGDSSLRQERVEAGLKRARLFSWRKCAQDTIAVYRAALA